MDVRLAIALIIALSMGFSVPAWGNYREAFAEGDYGTALKELLPLAQKGDVGAQFQLGVMYEYGRGVAQDNAEAALWYRKAAQKGLPEA